MYPDRVSKGSPEGMPMAESIPLRFFLLSHSVVYLDRVPKGSTEGMLISEAFSLRVIFIRIAHLSNLLTELNMHLVNEHLYVLLHNASTYID